MTASIFHGGDRPRIDPTPDDGTGDEHDFLCRLLDCLMRDESVQRWLKRQELDYDAILKCLHVACRKAGVDSRTAKPGTVRRLSQLDMDHIAGVVRRELLTAEPNIVFSTAAAPMQRTTSEAAVKRLSKSALEKKEHFPPSAQALERMKKPTPKRTKPKKGK